MSAAVRYDPALAAWVQDNCTFPNSMVDRITPVTADGDRTWLVESSGIEDRWPVVSEPFRQWVVEDDFAAGRPAWEDVGALFTNRVHDWELYKLRLLNAGHSSIAYLAALAGITYVHEAMAVPAIQAFVDALLHREALPTLEAIPGNSREDYIDSVLERFANSGVRDQIARLCIDGSAKFPTFLIPTVVRELELDGPIERSATALAGWARYLAVVDPADQAFDASADAARRYAADAMSDPVAFLEYAAVFPPAVKNSPRFREAFSESYQRVAGDGSIAALDRERAGETL
jgi:mannitol 2-dehydrogenase